MAHRIWQVSTRLATATVLLILTVGKTTTAATTSLGKYDPCINAGRLSRGNGFYVGVAFWPGGTIDDWGPVYNATLKYTGLNPCESTAEYNATELTHQQYLIAHGIVFRTYEVIVDRMTVLRGNKTEDDALAASIASNQSGVISLVMFRGRVRSEPRYLRSEDTAETRVNGIIQSLAIVASARAGVLQSFLWDDVTCNSCDGRGSKYCLTAASFDATQYSCTTAALNCSTSMDSLADPCTPALYMGFSGSDVNHQTFQSGYQISRVDQFSLIHYYQLAAAKLNQLYNSIAVGGIGSNSGGLGGSGVSVGDGSAA